MFICTNLLNLVSQPLAKCYEFISKYIRHLIRVIAFLKALDAPVMMFSHFNNNIIFSNISNNFTCTKKQWGQIYLLYFNVIVVKGIPDT